MSSPKPVAQVQLLETLRDSEEMLTRSQIVAATGRTPGTVSRLLWKLKGRGVVRCEFMGRHSRWGAA